MHLLEAEAADQMSVLAAEELHQLVVVRADAILQVPDGLAQLVDTEDWVVPVRPQVLLTERRHAGEAGVGRHRLHARIAADDILFLGWSLLRGQIELALARPQLEGPNDCAEHCVLLQLGFGGEHGPTLGAAVGIRPGLEEAVLAEVVSAGDGHRAVEGTQTDAAGQLFLQTQQGKVGLRHDGTVSSKTKLNNKDVKRN